MAAGGGSKRCDSEGRPDQSKCKRVKYSHSWLEIVYELYMRVIQLFCKYLILGCCGQARYTPCSGISHQEKPRWMVVMFCLN